MATEMPENIEISDAEIALRAYALWELEGQPNGKDVEHWFRARAEIEADAKAGASASTVKPADAA